MRRLKRTYSLDMPRGTWALVRQCDDDVFRRGRASLAAAVEDDGRRQSQRQSREPHYTHEGDGVFMREYLEQRERIRSKGRRILYPTEKAVV
jgi:hypothetical protein